MPTRLVVTLCAALLLAPVACKKESKSSPAFLAFTAAPTTVGVSRVMTTVSVAIQDGSGNTIADATNNVRLVLGANPGNATLTVTEVAAVDGIATFTDVMLDAVGTGYTLFAESDGPQSIESPVFDVLPNGLPTITTNRGLDFDLHVFGAQAEVELAVTVTDPEGDAVSLRLESPHPGLIFPDVVGVPSGTTVTGRWIPHARGNHLLRFVTRDDFEPGEQAVHRVRARLMDGLIRRVVTGDVTGDGIDDVIAGSTAGNFADVDDGAVFVFAGGDPPGDTPVAVLGDAAGTAGDSLASGGVLLSDVTGDGILDIVTLSPVFDSGATTNAGAIHLWAGGAGLTGTPAPTAVLTSEAAVINESLCQDSDCQTVDVTGDGIDDIVAVGADKGILVWAGGPVLSDTPAPTATLSSPTGGTSVGIHTYVRDLDGDAVPDILAVTRDTIGGAVNAGSLLFWPGGAALAGTPAPVVFSVTGSAVGDQLAQLGVQFQDIDGDGVDEIFALTPSADSLTGRIYVWNGTALATGGDPTAVLTAANTVRLGTIGLRFADVSGDTVPDVLVSVPEFRVGATTNVGAAFVFDGTTLTGTPPPLATLRYAFPTQNDRLGLLIDVGDVTGDGIDDVVVGSPFLSLGTSANAGGAFLWAGGPTLTGDATVTALLAAQPDRDAALGLTGLLLTDVTGDGLVDVVLGSDVIAPGGLGAGGAYVWAGGSGLSGFPAPPSAELGVPLVIGDGQQVGAIDPNNGFYFVRSADVSGDGVDDLVFGAGGDDLSNVVLNSGSVYVFLGGADVAGVVFPTATLRKPTPTADDFLGRRGTGLGGFADGIQIYDVSGDGIADLVATGAEIDTTTVDAGAAYVWLGGASLTGTPAPDASFEGNPLTDELCRSAVRFTDVAGDGLLDFIAASPLIDSAVNTDIGGVNVWTNPFAGGTDLTQMRDPTPTDLDRMSQ